MRTHRHFIREDLGGDLGIGCASHVEQQAHVIGLRGGVGIQAEGVAQAHGEQRASDPVFELHTECEIGGQGQRGDHFRGSDSILSSWACYRHLMSVLPPCHKNPQWNARGRGSGPSEVSVGGKGEFARLIVTARIELEVPRERSLSVISVSGQSSYAHTREIRESSSVRGHNHSTPSERGCSDKQIVCAARASCSVDVSEQESVGAGDFQVVVLDRDRGKDRLDVPLPGVLTTLVGQLHAGQELCRCDRRDHDVILVGNQLVENLLPSLGRH